MFEHPQFVYFIPLLLVGLMSLYINSRRKRRRRVLQLTQLNPENSPHRNHCYIRSRIKVTLILFGFLFLMIALARPQFGYVWKDKKQPSSSMLIMLDISRSMLVEDVYPNRLERAKLLIREIIASRSDAQIGLLVFAGDSFLQCPITDDYIALLETLNEQSPDLIAQQGSDFSRVFMKLPEFLEQTKDGTVILISDGEDHSLRMKQPILYLKNEKVKMHCICIGTSKGGLIPNLQADDGKEPYFFDPQGNVVFSKANPEHLKSIAKELDGDFAHFDSERYSLRKLNNILMRDHSRGSVSIEQKRIPVDYFQIPLFLSFLFFCVEMGLGTRKPESSMRKFG